MTPRPAVLAVDGGGSKIDAALLRRDGTVLGVARSRSGWVDESGDARHMDQIRAAVEAALDDARIDADQQPVSNLGVYCLAGADLRADTRRIEVALHRARFTEESLVRNDSFAVLRAGTDRGWGVAVVCGYGTNCCGVSPDGRTMRFPALGEISGDWGGGGDIGRAAVAVAIRGEDGRGRETSLSRLVAEHFEMKRSTSVAEAIYFKRLSIDRLVELTPIVFRAASGGDAVARGIVERQADEVVAMASAAIRRLHMTTLDPDIVLGGGVFRTQDRLFFERIGDGIHGIAPQARIQVLTVPPLVGAALLGLDRLGASGAVRTRVRAALTHERLDAHTREGKKE